MSKQSAEKIERKALTLFGALEDLNGDASARRELLASGVSAAVVDSLYPDGFDSFAPGLVAHFGGLLHKRVSESKWRITQSELDWIVRTQAKDLVNSFDHHRHQVATSPGMTAILTALTGKWKVHRRAAANLSACIWQTYWLMTHRAQLTAQGQLDADRHLLELASYLLGNPSRLIARNAR